MEHDNAAKSGKLYKKLKSIKFPGFRKGGVVSVDDIEKQVKENGDTGIVSVNSGEAFVPKEHVKPIQELVEAVPEINRLAEREQGEPDGGGSIRAGGMTLTPVSQDLFRKFTETFPGMLGNMAPINKITELVNPLEHLGAATTTNNTNNATFGDIYCTFELPNVVDEKSFIKTMQDSNKVRKCIQSFTVDQLAGSGRLAYKSGAYR